MINNIFKNQSIFFTITMTFLVSMILILISFTVLYKSSEKREEHHSHKRNIEVSQMVLRECRNNGISKELKQNLEEINFILIEDLEKQNFIFQHQDLVLRRTLQKRMTKIQHLQLKDKSYIYIVTPRNRILLENNMIKDYHQYPLLAIFLVILSIFMLLYFITINKLKPLKTLNKQMQDFAYEKFDIDCTITKKDEISQLANEFNITAKRLKAIKESRNIFIRNIMHELKTPITKGKFLTQLPQSEENIETMQKVFYRLESLISEFTSIEQLISTQKVIDKKEYYLSDIIDEAEDILMCNENEIRKDFKNIKINVDYTLFSIAIKNMLDNGIKYSLQKQVKVRTEDTKIIFENIGEKLIYPIENYFEPFFKGDNVKSNQSFGLGLYIVKHILDANDYTIEYEYKDGINIFALDKS